MKILRFFLSLLLVFILLLACTTNVKAGGGADPECTANCTLYDALAAAGNGYTIVRNDDGTFGIVANPYNPGHYSYYQAPDGSWYRVVGGGEEEGGGYEACRPGCPVISYPADNSTIEAVSPVPLSWNYAWTNNYMTASGGYYWCPPSREDETPDNYVYVNAYRVFPGSNSSTYLQKIAAYVGHSAYPGDPPITYNLVPPTTYGKSLVYDDPNLTYSGSWQNAVNENLINGTGKTTSQTGSTATLNFDGEGAVVTYWKRPYGGKMKITIDGDSANSTIIDQQVSRDSVSWQKVWTSPTLSSGAHSVRFAAPSWYMYPTVDAIVIGNTVYDNGNPQSFVTYDGYYGGNGWWPYDNVNAYGGSFMQVSAPGLYGYFNFTGDKFNIIYNSNASGGRYMCESEGWCYYSAPVLNVYIDDVLYQINEGFSDSYYNNESGYWQYSQEWISPQMTNGQHTITVEKVDSPVTQVGIDAISVADYSSIGIEGTYKWTVTAVGGNSMGSTGCSTNTFIIGSPEVGLKSLILRNYANTIVAPGVGGVNSVCNDFPRGRIKFDATVTNLKEGGGDAISKVYVGLYQNGVQKMLIKADGLDTGSITQSVSGSGASFYGATTTSVNGNDRTVSFPISFSGFPLGTYEVKVYGYVAKGVWMSATPPRFLSFDQCALSWWQVGDSDIQSAGDLVSVIPSGKYFNLPGLGGFPGIPAYAGSTTLSSEDVSAVGWLVNSTPVGLRGYDYAYFANQIPEDILTNMNSIDTLDVSESLSSGGTADTNDYYWYKYDGATSGNQDLTIPETNIGTRKVIVMVDNANVNITGNINLTDGQGFFMLVVNGNIVIDPTLGDSGGPNLEGLYFANGSVSTGVGNSQLWTRGSIVGYGGVALERDLGNDGNGDPSEYLEYAPDQIMLFPKVFGYRRINWKEVAP